MKPTTRHDTNRPARHRHLDRAATVVLAAVIAIALWAIVTQLLGVEVRSPEMGGEPPADITPGHVGLASLVASVAAWGLLAALERFIGRARTAWLLTSMAVLVVSLGAPLTGAGITDANRTVLVLLHVVVGAVIMAGLARTASAGRDPSPTANPLEHAGAPR